jgi:hypothetical protein
LSLDADRAKQRVRDRQHEIGWRIFVGLTRHDKILSMTPRCISRQVDTATRWHQFDPGLQTRADIQTEIVAELQAGKVRYVVLESHWDERSSRTTAQGAAISTYWMTTFVDFINLSEHMEGVGTVSTLSVGESATQWRQAPLHRQARCLRATRNRLPDLADLADSE